MNPGELGLIIWLKMDSFRGFIVWSNDKVKMKINIPLMLVAIIAVVLVAYAFFAFWPRDYSGTLKHALSITFAAVATAVFFGSLSLKLASDRIAILVKTTSGIFWLVGLISIIVVSILLRDAAFLIVIFGFELVSYLLSIYGISKAK